MQHLSPHTHALARLAKPSQAKPSHGWHGMAWFGRVCVCLIMCVSFWKPFTPKTDLNVYVKNSVHICFGHGIIMVE